MAYIKQLFIGKLSSVSPTYDNIVAINGDTVNGQNTITNVSPFNAAQDVSLLKVGQTINTVTGGGFSSDVTITNINGTTLTVDATSVASQTGGIFTADTPAGTYFINSASFFDPQNTVTVNDVTGSLDADYNEELSPLYSILGQAANSLGGSQITGKYHYYKITNVTYRDFASAEISAFVEWGEAGVESDSGDALFAGSNQTLAIGSMSVTSSQMTQFGDDLLTGLGVGADVGSYQITLPSVIDKTGSEDPFPYTGSAEITGSLEVTGSVDFLINNNETFKVSNALTPTQSLFFIDQEGVATFRAREGSDGVPPVTVGSVYFTTESVFFGFDDGV